MDRRLEGSTQSAMHFGTDSQENTPSQFSALSSTVPTVSLKQLSHEANTNPFTELSSSSTIAPSNEQSHDQAAIPNVPCAMSDRTCEQSQHPCISRSFTEQFPNSSSTNNSNDQRPVPDARAPGVESVSVRKKGRYEAHDRVDQYLFLQVSRHVQADMVELLAEYLGVSEDQYVDTRRTRTQPVSPSTQAMKVNTSESLLAIIDKYGRPVSQ